MGQVRMQLNSPTSARLLHVNHALTAAEKGEPISAALASVTVSGERYRSSQPTYVRTRQSAGLPQSG